MYFTYSNATQTGSNPALALDAQATSDDIRILKKILIGNPVSAATLTVFNENNALANNTTTVAFALTLPTFSSTNPNIVPLNIDFTTNSNSQSGLQGSDGLQLRGGGSVAMSSAMAVTFIWDFSET